jgi:NAD(P)-dependent dehydrogenase (short-subunit alcohol dehydrogenase family)
VGAPGTQPATRRARAAGLGGKVVVVTGASSGLGRAAAMEFARRGGTLVLAARRADALEDTARRCRAVGGDAIVVPTDVTIEADVANLARTALARFGRIDVWVNNAGVTLFALLEEAPFDEHRRVIETNLFGAILAARAVVPIFRRQGRGVLINVGSILSKIGQPYVPSYVISKFGLRGLTEALRAELADRPGIHVCTLMPYAIDTPHFESGANRVGRRAHSMPPVQTPEHVARALVDLAERPRRERHVPRVAVAGLALHALLPRTVERLILHILSTWHFGGGGEPCTEGNLYAADARPGHVRGVRPPRLGMPELAVWIARNLARILARPAPHPRRRPAPRPAR